MQREGIVDEFRVDEPRESRWKTICRYRDSGCIQSDQLIYLNNPAQWTLSLGLSAFLNTHTTEWNLLLAAATLFTLPMIVIFFAVQRYFMQGISFTTDVG